MKYLKFNNNEYALCCMSTISMFSWYNDIVNFICLIQLSDIKKYLNRMTQVHLRHCFVYGTLAFANLIRLWLRRRVFSTWEKLKTRESYHLYFRRVAKTWICWNIKARNTMFVIRWSTLFSFSSVMCKYLIWKETFQVISKHMTTNENKTTWSWIAVLNIDLNIDLNEKYPYLSTSEKLFDLNNKMLIHNKSTWLIIVLSA